MIPFGAWHPDSAGVNSPAVIEAKNCIPAVVTGQKGAAPAYSPERAPVAVSDALAAQCFGLAAVVQNSGSVVEIAGTATKLYRLNSPSWVDVSRTVGGAYTLGSGERWRFAGWNPLIIATNYTDAPQKYDTSLITPTFAALGGSPPKARFVGVVRDQVVLACLYGQESALQFSGYNNAELWTTGGVGGADIQSFPDGGPITGFVGGTIGHVFQATKVSRMTSTTDSTKIFQFDEVQGGKGSVAPNAIVKVGDYIFYFAADGFQRLTVSTGQVEPVGNAKWRLWFLGDYRPGTETMILGAADPLNPIIKWAYSSSSVSGTLPNRVIVYNWQLDEATFEDISVEAMSQWLTSSVTLDTMTPYGNMETLPFSLDSPFWKAGVPLLSIVDSAHKLNYLEGQTMAAEWITSDGQRQGRSFIVGTTPVIDTSQATVAVSMRERVGDIPQFGVQEVMEDTGMCSAWASGNVARARVQTPQGASWSVMSGLTTSLGDAGVR